MINTYLPVLIMIIETTCFSKYIVAVKVLKKNSNTEKYFFVGTDFYANFRI